MNRTGVCPKCGGNHIAGPHRLHGYNQHVCIDLPGILTATLESFTCVDCGYTELYSDQLGLDNIRSHGRFRVPQQSTILRTCPVCATKVPSDSNRCPECGYQLN